MPPPICQYRNRDVLDIHWHSNGRTSSSPISTALCRNANKMSRNDDLSINLAEFPGLNKLWNSTTT
eukprot:scaffold637994_cov122-Attheya_sp.AAC.1